MPEDPKNQDRDLTEPEDLEPRHPTDDDDEIGDDDFDPDDDTVGVIAPDLSRDSEQAGKGDEAVDVEDDDRDIPGDAEAGKPI